MSIQRLGVRITRGNSGLWEGLVGIMINGQTYGFRVEVDEEPLREALAARHVPEGGGVGFFKALGSWISKTAKKVARWKVWKKVGEVVKKVVNSPVLAGVIGVASTVFPAIGATYVAAKAAINVVSKVASGDTKALKGVGDLAKAAAANNPLAAQAVDALKAADKSPLAQFIPKTA